MGMGRRELKSRSTRWAQTVARALANAGIRPNMVSIFSVILAIGAGACLVASQSASGSAQVALYLVAIMGIQLRLLCNLMDGMLAIEHNLKSALGELYNDVPDRIADSLILIGFGYAAKGPFHAELGWLLALLSIFTAYLRVLGGSLQVEQRYLGPMAKQHRMAAATSALVLSLVLSSFVDSRLTIYVALILITIGTFTTCFRRLAYVAGELQKRDP